MKKNGYSVVEMLVVIAVMGIVTFAVIGATSSAFKDNSSLYYEDIECVVVRQAKIYGESLDSLKSEGNLVITLDDMVKAGYYVADNEDGEVIDPRNSKATLNGMKIKLSISDDGTIEASVIEEE